jgi:hypothetical protein
MKRLYLIPLLLMLFGCATTGGQAEFYKAQQEFMLASQNQPQKPLFEMKAAEGTTNSVEEDRQMEVTPLATALISILFSVLTFMIGLLITMLFGIKKDLSVKTERIYGEIKEINNRLNEMLPIDEYKDDKKAINVKLDEHGQKILRLEIKKVINGVSR